MGRNQLLSSSTSGKVWLAVHRFLLWLEGSRVVAPLLTLLLLHLLLRGPPALAVHHPIPTKAGDGKNLPRWERTIVPSTPIPPQTQPTSGHRAEFHLGELNSSWTCHSHLSSFSFSTETILSLESFTLHQHPFPLLKGFLVWNKGHSAPAQHSDLYIME